MTKRGTSYAFDGDEPIYEHDDYYRAYGYDLQNRLVKVSGYVDGVLTVLATYTYAGDNLRLTKTASGVATRYVHGIDGNELYRATGTDSVSTVWLFGRKLVEIEQAGGTEARTYLHTDHLGSVVAATDETGATIWLGDNSAFGIATADAGLESRTASYTGKDYDSEAGLYYFNARWYDAELGRFTTEDPAMDDVNWYVYCANRPMTNMDLDGYKIKPINSVYRMNQQNTKWNKDDYILGQANSGKKFRENGCLVTTAVNVILTYSPTERIDPKYINDQKEFFSTATLPADLDTNRVLRVYGLDYSRGSDGKTGIQNMDQIIQLNESETEYGIIARVMYNYERDTEGNLIYRDGEGNITTSDKGTTTELLHFIGVRSVFEGEIDGKKGRWIEVAASSTSDQASGYFSTNRPLSSWQQKDGKVYVNEEAIRRVDTVTTRPVRPRSGGSMPE